MLSVTFSACPWHILIQRSKVLGLFTLVFYREDNSVCKVTQQYGDTYQIYTNTGEMDSSSQTSVVS